MKHIVYTLLAVTALSFPITQAMAQNAGAGSSGNNTNAGTSARTSGSSANSLSGNLGTNPSNSMSGNVGVNTRNTTSATNNSSQDARMNDGPTSATGAGVNSAFGIDNPPRRTSNRNVTHSNYTNTNANALQNDNGTAVNNNARGSNTASGMTSGTVYSTNSMDAETIRSIQRSLNDRGYRVGRIDGQWNTTTASELRRFEQSQGLTTSAGTNLNAQTLQNLGIGLDNITPSAGQTGGQVNGNINTNVTGSPSR